MADSRLRLLADQLRVIASETKTVAGQVTARAAKMRQSVASLRQLGAHDSNDQTLRQVLERLEFASTALQGAADALDRSSHTGEQFATALVATGRGASGEPRASPPAEGSGPNESPQPLGDTQYDAAPVADLISQHPDLPVYREASGHRGNWNQQLNTPPTTAIVVVDNNFAYRTDQFGRVVEAVGRLDTVLSPEENRNRRNESQQRKAGGSHRIRDLDDGGHIFAAQFGGAGEGINLLAQHRDQNRASKRLLDNWHAMEQKWRKLVEDGHIVDARVVVAYDAESRRPKGYSVSQTVDGVPQRTQRFSNPRT